MNKYQEAIEFFRKLATRIPLKVATDEFCEQYDNNYLTLKELVDKATPKKPIEKLIDCYCGEIPSEKELHYYCECGEWIGDEAKKYNYCPSCGQAIDWSGEGKGERNEK